jgi:hypothetical protein
MGMRYSMFIVSKDIMYNGTCAMELTRKHVVLSFISGGMGHLILSQNGTAHMQDERIGAMELLTLEDLSNFLKKKIKKESKSKRDKKVRMAALAPGLQLCST